MKKLLYIILFLIISFSLSNANFLDIFKTEDEKANIVKQEKNSLLIKDIQDTIKEENYFISISQRIEDKQWIRDNLKIVDSSGIEQKVQFYIEYSDMYHKKTKVTISGDFKPEKYYKLIIKGNYQKHNNPQLVFDVEKSFFFESKPLTKEDMTIIPNIVDMNNAFIEINFLKENIKTKNIRDFIEFPDKNFEYSYKVSEDKLTLYGDFKANQFYSFRLKKGFVAGLKKREEDLLLSIKFGDLNKKLNFKNNNSYVSSYTEAIELESINIEKVKIDIRKINPENTNYLNIFKNYLLENKYNINGALKNYSEEVTKYTKNIIHDKNKVVSTLLNFKESLKYKDDGIYTIKISTKDGFEDSKLIYKSDLGISTKISKNQMFLSLRSLANTKAINNAEIYLYSDKNKLIFKGKTNEYGIFIREYKNLIKEKPKLIIAKKNNQINFLNLKESISNFDILNDYESKVNSEYKALVFMERTLLRPNDSVGMLISVKDKSLISLKNQNIYIKVLDPVSKVVIEDTLKLNDAGVVNYSYKSFNDNKTGKYRLQVFLGDDQIGSKEFYVEAFIPERIEVKIDSLKDKIWPNEELEFKIKSKYLIGVPAKDLKYNYDITMFPSSFQLNEFKDFTFSDELNKQKDLLSSNIKGEDNLDEKGEKKLKIKLPLEKTSYSLLKSNIIVTVSDDGRPVRKYKEVIVYPFKKVVGIKKLFKGVAQSNSTLKFKTILVDTLKNQKIKTNEKLQVKIFKKFWHYYSGEEIREIESFEVDGNNEIEFKPKRGGDHYLSVTTKDGQTSTIPFYVSWWGNDPTNLKDKSSYKVTLKPNKEVFNKNDILTIDLKSPIVGTLILTVEEDRILDYKIIDLTTTTANFDLKMPSSIKKGAYIKAHIVRSTKESDEIFPFRAIGSVYVKKYNGQHNSKAEIFIKELHKSSDEIKIKVKATNSKNAYAVISLVDKGILNIIDEKDTDAFKFFDNKEKSQISLYDLYSNLQQHLLLQAQSMSGDGITKKRKKFNSPDAINERVKPVSFWSKLIELDENQEATVSFKTNNFNGELRAQTLIVDENTISSDVASTIIKDDIVIKPILPRFLIQDDKAIIPLRLMNTTSSKKEIKLDLITTKNLNTNNLQKTITIEANNSVVENVTLHALNPGLSKIRFVVKVNDEKFSNETSILIKDKYDYKVVSKFGTLNKGETADIKIINNEMKALEAPVNAYLSIDDTPFSKLLKSYKYLIGYPYGCAEQTSSKVMAMLLSDKFINKDDKESFILRKKYINDGIDKLVSMQNNNGYFSYWQGGDYVNNYASFYTMYVLQLSKLMGFDVPDSTINNALKAHWGGFRNNISQLDFFISYVDEKTANEIYDNKSYGNTLTSYVALAAAMKNAGNYKESELLIHEAKQVFLNYDRSKERSYNGSFYSPIKDFSSSLFLYKSIINKDKNDSFSKDLIRTINNYIEEDKLYSTQDKAFAMLSLITYYEDIDTSKSDINVDATYNNKIDNIKKKEFKDIVLNKSDSISLKNNGSVINYTIDINKPIELPINNIHNNTKVPISIRTNFRDNAGRYIKPNDIIFGEKYYIEVVISSLKKIDNVAVSIKIPSGLDIFNKRLSKDNNLFSNKNYNPDYEDYRDDRFLTFLTTNNVLTKFYVPVTAVTKGTFTNPASYIEAMYDSRLNNYYKASKTITIK